MEGGKSFSIFYDLTSTKMLLSLEVPTARINIFYFYKNPRLSDELEEEFIPDSHSDEMIKFILMNLANLKD